MLDLTNFVKSGIIPNCTPKKSRVHKVKEAGEQMKQQYGLSLACVSVTAVVVLVVNNLEES